jgi:hypothetical protein
VNTSVHVYEVYVVAEWFSASDVSDLTWLYAEKNSLRMPLLFFSLKMLFSPIILLRGLSPSDLPNFCSRLLMSDFDFVKKRHVLHFFQVQGKLQTFHIAFSSIRQCQKSRKISSLWTTKVRYPRLHFKSVFDL